MSRLIMGIDPGSLKTGYGLILQENSKFKFLCSGVIAPKKNTSLAEKLEFVFENIDSLLKIHKPDALVIEKIFTSINIQSALVLAHVRGVILLSSQLHKIKYFEYTPKEIKQAISGQGNASKNQVLKMIELYLKPKHVLSLDEADAVAAAVCYAHKIRL